MTELLWGMWQYILTFNISIFDVLDVAIIAYIVYRVLMLVQRSRAAQVAKAILLLLVALGLSYLLQLRVINFVLSRMVEMGTLALVVVFQPEIRRFLEQLGSSRLGDMFSREEAPPDVENAITQTVQAYTSLSKDKVGALMVFERKVPLDDIIKTGTMLDSTVAAELLKNLFWNKAPLHDGAVIVRNGHIVEQQVEEQRLANQQLEDAIENSDAPETLERLLRNELLPQEESSSKSSILTSLFKSKKGDKDDGEEVHGK